MPVDPLQVRLVRRDEGAQGVAPELLSGRPRQFPRDGRLAHDRERLDGRDVAPFDERLAGLAGFEIDRGERLHQRRQRLQRGADNDLLAVRDPALDPARAIGRPVQPALVADDLVVGLRAPQAGELEPLADLDALDGLNTHQRGGQARVEPVLLRCVGTEAGRRSLRAHFDDAAQGVSLRAGLVDLDFVGARPRPRLAADGDADLREQRLRNRARRNRNRRLARARALECVPDVLEPELLRPGEIGVARPRQCHRLRPLSLRLALGRPGAHPPGPVFVIAVADDERERRPERPAMAQTRKHLDLVLFQLLARTAAVALLPAAQVGVDGAAVEDETRRQAGENRDQGRTVRLARGCQRQHQSERTAARITSTGGGTPVQSSNEAAPWRTSASRPSMTSQPASRAAATSAVARPPASYARSTTVCPARGSTSSSSRTGVAFTIRSASEASGGQASLRENSRTSPGSAGNSAFAAPPAPIRQTRLASRPATIALSVLKPSRRPPRKTSVFTEGP